MMHVASNPGLNLYHVNKNEFTSAMHAYFSERAEKASRKVVLDFVLSAKFSTKILPNIFLCMNHLLKISEGTIEQKIFA